MSNVQKCHPNTHIKLILLKETIPNKLANTITKHVPRYTSIDLTYDILGNAAFVEDISVVIVSTVVTPNATRAGVAFRFNQNETQDIITISPEGI